MSVLNRSYSSFRDPYLTNYFDNERRSRQYRKFGLVNEHYEVYPETIYEANIREAERREALASKEFEKRAQERLHKLHLEQHRLWNQRKNEQRLQRVQSTRNQTSNSTQPDIRLPDVSNWSRQDFIKHGFDYYPDQCHRPQTSLGNEWHRIRGQQVPHSVLNTIYNTNPYNVLSNMLSAKKPIPKPPLTVQPDGATPETRTSKSTAPQPLIPTSSHSSSPPPDKKDNSRKSSPVLPDKKDESRRSSGVTLDKRKDRKPSASSSSSRQTSTQEPLVTTDTTVLTALVISGRTASTSSSPLPPTLASLPPIRSATPVDANIMPLFKNSTPFR
ncbi:unnamed protein product [Didymodactylos carnosus]|uniref:Uncharacterized protein n=1 Tax=Didymodactylos carnosus TaxID=1234261 RepID=A0A815W0A0_9BILA|nr:unnamed protein product [Didymodactylos carnosus]CAF4396898.1 unnamed protein product [Didymodactylos carnosus]